MGTVGALKKFKVSSNIIHTFLPWEQERENILDSLTTPKLFWEEGECVNHEIFPNYLAMSFAVADIEIYLLNDLTYAN